MTVGIITVFLFAFRRLKRQGIGIDDALIVSACTLFGALTCASVLYAFVTYPVDFIIKAIFTGDFSVFGGLVFYGGLIGGMIGAMAGLKIAKADFKKFENAIIPFFPIGHGIGRIGCVMAGCCNGFEYDGIFAITYGGHSYFPVQIIEALLNVLIAVFLILYSKKDRPKYNILLLYLSFYSLSRFTLEFFRGDAVRGILLGLSTSQWIALTLLALSAGWAYIKKFNHT